MIARMDPSMDTAGPAAAQAPDRAAALDPAEQPIRRVTWGLHRTELAIQAAKEPELRAAGVPAAHYALLMNIRTFPGLNGAEIARRLGVTTQAVALLANKLQTRGLIERRTHPRHRNIQELHLTAAGNEALDRAEAVVVRVERRVHETLGPERYQQLRTLLDDVVAGLADYPDEDPARA
jgi:DNA-binding MarR family transcriptional regulator